MSLIRGAGGVAAESSSVSVICCCFPGKAGVAMTIVCRPEPVHGRSIHTPPPLMLFILPAGRGGGCKDAHGEVLGAALQHGEKFRPFWLAPFPKENYFWGASGAGERGLIYIKSFCTLSSGLSWAGSRSARYRSSEASRNAANHSSFSSTPGCL